MFPDFVLNLCQKRNVFLSAVIPLSDGFWLPNCGGDTNGGGIVVSPDGTWSFMTGFWDDDDNFVSVLDQLAADGIVPISK